MRWMSNARLEVGSFVIVGHVGVGIIKELMRTIRSKVEDRPNKLHQTGHAIVLLTNEE